MRHNIHLITLAALVALALAAVSGALLPADNVVFAEAPAFDTTHDPSTRSVDENTPPGVNIGRPISATDPDEDTLEYGDTLTYSLEGTDAASFDIDASTGQLITKAALDRETKDSYSVRVKVDDGESRDPDVTQDVTITVTGVPEPPAAPAAPTVVSGNNSTTSLKVIWHPPENTGRPTITGYRMEYKKSAAPENALNFTEFDVNDEGSPGGDTIDLIPGLEAGTSYQVRVLAVNKDGESPWSLVGTGSTNKEGNSAPQFIDASTGTRRVDENTPAGEDVGSPVTASDGDSASLTYGLKGRDADLFNFDTRSGQIWTKAPLNHESARCGYIFTSDSPTECIYRVTVTVVDGAGGSDAKIVEIEVENKKEPPSAPARPIVRATKKSSTSLDVSWDAPENTGPPITNYDVQYRTGSKRFSDNNCDSKGVDNCAVTDTTVTITELDSNTSYAVRVRAKNTERLGDWSATGTGKTGKANHQPIFDARPHSGAGSVRNSDHSLSRTIDENISSGRIVGRVFADDEDNDKLTYKLAGTHADLFDINETTGQIRTKTGVTYNYEQVPAPTSCDPFAVERAGSDKCYRVEVEVRDGLDDDRVEEEETTADDSITVKIGVRDRDEPPSAPAVTVTSPADNMTLIVTWDAPENTGPLITNYDVQYRKGSGAFSDDNCGSTGDHNCAAVTGAATTATITQLDPDTSYSVQVRARNEEGVSAWSRLVTEKTNKAANDPPEFTDIKTSSIELEVRENTPAGRDVGNAVSATDDSTTSLTYRLEGSDAGLFNFDKRSGQIRTRAKLNHEDPGCGYDSTDDPTTCNYTVRVKVVDGDGGSVSKGVHIKVIDEDEPPSAPSAPRVTATKDSGRSLDVTWTEPRNTGKPPIVDYDIQYRKVGDGSVVWENWPHATESAGNADRSTKITRRAEAEDAASLESRTQYEVRVRAKNGEGDATENWSPVGRGTTGASNRRPSFDREDAVVTLRVSENTRSGQSIGSAVSASDADSNRLTYNLEGPNKDLFTIVSSTGQIRTKAPLDYESRQGYSVTVKVDDGTKRENSSSAKSVTITVDNAIERPAAPAAPRVAGIPGSTDSVRVTWDAPANTGPPVTGYDVHYKEVGSGFGRWSHPAADRSVIITGLKAGTRYEVQVRARSEEGTSEWSRSGTGSPNPDVANRNPQFSGRVRTLSVPENTLPNTDIGAPVSATDRDGDTLTYTLEGTDADSFNILSTSDGGQIRTSSALNHEEKSSYSVTVRVTDGRGGADAVNVTIRVTDVDGEAPGVPFAPTVTAVSSTSLSVSWDAPENTGPPITDYDYRYRDASGSWTEVTNTTITGTTATIEGLTSSTSYDVEVRAKNAEGTSDWSNPGIGSTAAPGANSPPVFSDGSSTTRSVSAAAPADTLIGDPVAATDADSGDTLTYSLQGMNAASFDIRSDTGQLITSSGVTLTVGTTYTVTVVASDGKDRTEITVTIEVTAAPPNKAPVFLGGPRSFTVRENAAAGTSIGSPVRATDADGDTLTYSLEGTDASSFDIRTNTGQIVTRSGVSLRAGATQTVTVVADDGKTGRATVAVTIRIIQGTFGCDTRGAVSDRSNTGLVSDCESLLVARNALEGSTRLNWSVVTPIEQWEGVYLNGTNGMPTRVTAIVLRRRGLDGTIPAELGQLPMLTQLNLHSNDLTGSIPGDLARLSRLERLLLHNNRLTGTIPNLSGLRNLKMLWLSGKEMGLTGPVPSWLNSMSGLESLSLWGNDLSGPIPRLTGMTSLSLLKLQSNNLTGGVPSWLGEMSSLRGLYIHANPLGGTIPPELGRLTRLRRIWLHSSQLNGEIPRELANMTNLATLNLRGNRLTGPIPPALGLMGELQQLLLHDNELTGSIPSQLGSLSKLQKLWLSQNRLTGLIPESLGGLSSLTQLNLHTNQLSGEFPLELDDLGDTLTRLRLTGNTGLTGCVPAALAGAIDAEDLRGAGSAGLSICN